MFHMKSIALHFITVLLTGEAVCVVFRAVVPSHLNESDCPSWATYPRVISETLTDR